MCQNIAKYTTLCPNASFFVFFMPVDPKYGLPTPFKNFWAPNGLAKDGLYSNFDNVSFYSNLASPDKTCGIEACNVHLFSVPIYREPAQHRGLLQPLIFLYSKKNVSFYSVNLGQLWPSISFYITVIEIWGFFHYVLH